MARHKDANWTVPEGVTDVQATLCVLMDIRDELKANGAHLLHIRQLLSCHRIPRALDAVVAMHKQGVKRRYVRKRKAT